MLPEIVYIYESALYLDTARESQRVILLGLLTYSCYIGQKVTLYVVYKVDVI